MKFRAIAGAGGNNNGYMYAYILPDAPAGSITITANEIGYYDAVFVSVIEFTNANASPFDASGRVIFVNMAPRSTLK